MRKTYVCQNSVQFTVLSFISLLPETIFSIVTFAPTGLFSSFITLRTPILSNFGLPPNTKK